MTSPAGASTRPDPRQSAPSDLAEKRKQLAHTKNDARVQLLQAADALAALRKEFPVPPPTRPEPRKATGFERALAWVTNKAGGRAPTLEHGTIAINDPLDRRWAHEVPALSSLAHVFHSHWHGIRAAAGYLPGEKIAIPSELGLSPDHVRTIIGHLATSKPKTVVFHGWSENAQLLARSIRACFEGIRLSVVWHGNTSQFTNPFEFAQVGNLIELKRQGVIDVLASVKPDLHLMSDAFSPLLLINATPKVDRPVQRANAPNTALVPVPNDWRKNYFTNIFSAQAAAVGVTYVTTPLPEPMHVKPSNSIVVVARPSRRELFDLMPQIGVILNATLSECQPMTALEGLAFGVPCLTGPLALGDLDRHPYQRLAQVMEVDTIGPVSRAIVRLRDLAQHQPAELADMMTDYQTMLLREAFARWEEFAQ